MKTSSLFIILFIFAALAYFIVANGNKESSTDYSQNYDLALQNVSVVEDKQIITIEAKGGFNPRRTYAKAGIPTILKMETVNTFDCSSSVRIPSMDISKSLPPTGVVEIDLGVPKVSLLKGTCGMGMYPFEIDFQE